MEREVKLPAHPVRTGQARRDVAQLESLVDQDANMEQRICSRNRNDRGRPLLLLVFSSTSVT